MKRISYFRGRLRWILPKAGPGLCALAGIAAMFSASCGPDREPLLYRIANAPRSLAATPASSLIPVTPPPFTEGIFPCSNCHTKDAKVNRTPHPVEFHANIVLHHDEKNRWCLDCHDAQNRDRLHLADGRLIEFTESYRLCGQCHGPTLRAWKAGEHGKRTGSWSGEKMYRLCVSCHSPHSPHFKPLKPEPPPMRQEQIR